MRAVEKIVFNKKGDMDFSIPLFNDGRGDWT